MPRKTKIIFITVFILVGAIMLSIYFYSNRNSTSSTTTNTNSQYKPFLGSSNATDTTTTGTSSTTDTTTNTTTTTDTATSITNPDTSKFHKLTEFSVAGASFFEDTRPIASAEVALTGGEQPLTTTTASKTTNKKTVTKTPPAPKFEIIPSLRYVERVTGHIDQMYLDTKATGEISNSTIPGIYEALFDDKAASVIYRYLSEDGKTITTFLAALGGAKGEFMPSNILDISLSPDKTKFFYLTKTFSGVSGSVRSFKDTRRTQVFTSSLTEWLSQWVSDQKIYLTTKASASVEGDLFSLNIVNGVLTKVFGGVPGLTTLANSDGSLVLYSMSTNAGPKLQIFNVKNHTSVDLNLFGLPEKCVWGDVFIYCSIPGNISGLAYPDLWYQGLASFDDRFVKINTTTNALSAVADSTYGTPVDGTHLFLDNKETQLFFINKKDSTLWSLDLN